LTFCTELLYYDSEKYKHTTPIVNRSNTWFKYQKNNNNTQQLIDNVHFSFALQRYLADLSRYEHCISGLVSAQASPNIVVNCKQMCALCDFLLFEWAYRVEICSDYQ